MSHRRPARHATSLLITLGLLAGCVMACAAPNPLPSGTPPGPFPARPYTIDVVKIDPCSVLTADQARQRGARKGRPVTVDVGVGAPSNGCGWTNFDDGYRYNFQTIEADAALSLQMPGTSVTVIDGFGAALNVPDQSQMFSGPGIPLICQMTIDVNTDQAIRVQVQSDDNSSYGSAPEQEKSCARVQTFAHDVLSTLSSQQH